MTMDADPIAIRLMREHADGTRFTPFAAASGIATLDDAYRVQRAYVHLQREARSAASAGYKIGLTSPAMQAMCGISTPVAGVVLADRVQASGVVLDRSHYGRLCIEFEIAVRLGRDLRGDVGIADVEAALAGVAPAIEVVDDRHCDYKTLDVLSLVADNAWNAGIVLGAWRASWPDLARVTGAVHVDGAAEPLATGRGADVLGHPYAPVAWLAGHLAQRGECLRTGDIVTTGSMITTRFPEAPGDWRYDVEGLGSVALRVT
ncbi:MAG: fumarylacetoacetate hydrolase family protein [Proteobacteria bacterium]|nr:fumarylacetoacetate hydrolase family protein [Pseudomonadota bacterium]